MRARPGPAAVDLAHAADRRLPRELLGAGEALRAQLTSKRLVARARARCRRRWRCGSVRVDEHGRVAGHLGQRRHVRRDDRRAAGHGFERRQPEALVERRKHEHAGEPVHDRERLFRHVAQEAHVLVELMRVHRATQRRVLRDFVADEHELQMIEAALAHEIERLDQALEVLVRLDVAGVEHELVVQLIALAHARDQSSSRGSMPKRSSYAL